MPPQRPMSSLHILRVDVFLVVACAALLFAATMFKSIGASQRLSSKMAVHHSRARPAVPTHPPRDPLANLSRAARALVEKQARVDYRAVWMGALEVDLVLRYMHRIGAYLEWGSGGSTYNFAQFARRAYSIEHDQQWCSRVEDGIRARPELAHLRYHCVPVPRGTKGWGLADPFEEGNYEVFKAYVDEIARLGEPLFDFVLIDGRARVDAAIKALSFISRDSVVVMHDAERIWTRRAYRNVSKYYDIIDSVGGKARQGLAVMKRNAKHSHLEGNHAAVQRILHRKYPSTREHPSQSTT